MKIRITTIEGYKRTGQHPELVSKKSKVGKTRRYKRWWEFWK